MSSVINKIKDALTPDKSDTNTGTAEGVHGPHSSRVANAADPRVDSDMDHRAAPASMAGGPEVGYATGDNYSSTGRASDVAGTGAGIGSALPGPAPTTAGPHKSDALNKAVSASCCRSS